MLKLIRAIYRWYSSILWFKLLAILFCYVSIISYSYFESLHGSLAGYPLLSATLAILIASTCVYGLCRIKKRVMIGGSNSKQAKDQDADNIEKTKEDNTHQYNVSPIQQQRHQQNSLIER